MEPITKADLKAFFAEIRGEIKQWVAEGFRSCKPAAEAQDSSLQVAVDPLDLSALKACSVEGLSRDTAESSSAPAPTTALMASTTPPPTTGDAIPVFAAATASDGTFDEVANTATPDIVERSPEVVLTASTGLIITAPTTCSMEGLGRETTESWSAPAQTMAPTVHTATVDIDPVLVAPAASDGTMDDQAVNGIASTPTTCLRVCRPQHLVAAPVLVATLTEYSVDTNRIHVAVVSLAMTAEFSADVALTDSAPTVQLQQLYNNSESFMFPTSSQCILAKVVVHRPMPWPSFVCVHAEGDEARPLPWPSFNVICDCEFPRDATACAVIRFSVTTFYRILELKLFPIFSTVVTLSAVIVDSGNFAAFACEYLGIYTTVCICIWLFAGCLLVVCQKYSVQSSTDYLIASGYGSRLLITMDCSHLKELVFLNSVTRPASSYDQLLCANQYTSCFPGYSVTSSPIQDFVACSSRHLFPSGFWVSFRPVVMLDLQIARGCCGCVYLQKLQMDKGGIEVATSGDKMCERILAPNFSFAWAKLICFSSSEECALLAGFFRSGARIKSEINKDVGTDATNAVIAVGISNSSMVRSRFGTVRLRYIPAVYTPILVGHIPSSVSAATYSQENVSYMLAQQHVAWALSIAVASMNLMQSVLAVVPPHESYPGVQYSHGNVSEGWPSGYMTMALGIISGVSLKCNNYICCWYKILVRLVVATHQKVKLIELFLRDVASRRYEGSDGYWWHVTTWELIQFVWATSHGQTASSQRVQTALLTEICLPNTETIMYALVAASSEVMFMVAFGGGQAPFQEGRDIIRAAFSDQVHLNLDYYIAFINQISADSYSYFNQALYFDTGGTELIYYREDSHGDSNKSKELHVPWDPGKLVLRYHQKLRLEDKPSFKEGGVLAPSPAYLLLGCYDGLVPMGRAQVLALLLLIHRKRPSTRYPVGSRQRHGTAAASSSHLALISYLFLLLLFSTLCLYLDELDT